jgi:hypothetical protein
MRNTLTTVIALGLLAHTLGCATAPVGPGKVYTGRDGESVSVVPLTTPGPKGEKQALLAVQGSNSDFDDTPMLHSVSEQDRGTSYITRYKGSDFYTLVLRESHGAKKYELWVPNHRNVIIVSDDEKHTQELKPADIYSRYEKLRDNGTLAKLMNFNREERQSSQWEGFTKVLKSMNEACGTHVEATIDWKSISDDILKQYSIASYCGNPLEALTRLCGSPVGKRIIQTKLSKYSCQFGPELKLEANAGGVNFTTQQDAANQEEFATQYFMKNF